MLRARILGTPPKDWVTLMFCAIPIFFFFFFFFHPPTSWGLAITDRPSVPSGNNGSSIALAIGDTKDLADQTSIFDSTLEGGARIRQACMLFSSNDIEKQMGESVAYERSVRTHLKHAERWGYPSHILREDIVGHGKWEVLVFGKLLYLQSIIIAELTKPRGKRAEWIVWFDADTIILNENIHWSLFLPPNEDFNEIYFLGNKDWNSFNCGVFMMRINEWSVNFLTQAIALPFLKPDVPIGPNMEQDAMIWVLHQEGYKEHAVYQPRLWYNAFSEGPDRPLETKSGDMLIHFPGVPQKAKAMGHWLDIVENEPEKLNIPLANLTLRNDIKDFWANLRAAKQVLQKAVKLMTEDIVVHKGLGKTLKQTSDNLERLIYEEPFEQEKLKNATLLADAVVNKAFNAKIEEEERIAKTEEAERIAKTEEAERIAKTKEAERIAKTEEAERIKEDGAEGKVEGVAGPTATANSDSEQQKQTATADSKQQQQAAKGHNQTANQQQG